MKCITEAWRPNYFGKLGTVVVCAGRRYKVLFDCDRVEDGRMDEGCNLAAATWCLDLEIETASEPDEIINDLQNAGVSQKEAVDVVNECLATRKR